jgi:hypothetical protein
MYLREYSVPVAEMTGDDFSMVFFPLEANYSQISKFFGSDRRTGHRWTKGKPSVPVARFLQLAMALGLTLAEAKILIEAGVDKAGGGAIPRPVLDLKGKVAKIRASREDRDDTRLKGGKNPSTGAASSAA